MDDAVTLALHMPIGASGDLLRRLVRVAGEVHAGRLELSGTWEQFLSLGEVTPAMPVGALPTESWFIEGFLNDQVQFQSAANEVSVEEQFNRAFAAAMDAGVGRISIAPARIDGPTAATRGGLAGAYANELNRTAGILSMMLPIAQRLGVDVCLRAGEGGFLTSPVELREFVTTINAPSLGVELSTQMTGGLPPWQDWFSTLEPYVRTVRIDLASGEEGSRAVSMVREVREAIERLCHPRTHTGSMTVRMSSEAS
ncbi:MAG: hypothetical protein GXP29_05860 [Planctomycetes bacterium]|nr:hypothetical protein [Planctomycetota bacterium]